MGADFTRPLSVLLHGSADEVHAHAEAIRRGEARPLIDGPVDLRGANMCGADLSGATLAGADLRP